MGKNYKPEYDLVSALDDLMTRLNKVACKRFVIARQIRLRRLNRRIDAISRLMKFELGQTFEE